MLDYYPRVVEEGLFEDVKAMRGAGRRQPGTKKSRVTHILAGLARCGLCGATMTRVYKGRKGGKPKLVCTTAKAGAGCTYQAVGVEEIEQAIIENAGYLAGTAPLGEEQLDAELKRLETVRAAILEQLDNLADAIASGGETPTLRGRLTALEIEREKREKEYDALVERIGAAARPTVERRLEVAVRAFEAPEDKAAINAILRQALTAVVVDRKEGRLRFEWAHGGSSVLDFAWPLEGAAE